MRGEFPLLWSFTDSASTDEETKDDTIEPPAEAAQRARAEAKAQADSNGSDEITAIEGEGEAPAEEDDSWMIDPVGIAGGDGKVRKRKNKKK